MALKNLFAISVLIIAMTFHSAKAQGTIGGLLGMISIQGNVKRTQNGNETAPPFPKAEVQLQCRGKMVSSTTADDAGNFEIMIDPMEYVMSSLLQGCQLVVITPLSECSASLPPVGGLVSMLHLLGNHLMGKLLVANLDPLGFVFNPNITHY